MFEIFMYGLLKFVAFLAYFKVKFKYTLPRKKWYFKKSVPNKLGKIT